MASLYELTGEALVLQEMLEMEDGDPAELEKELESISKDMDKKFDAYLKIYYNNLSDADQVDAEIKRLQKRKKALTNNADKIKNSVMTAMQVLGKDKFKSALFSASIRKTPESVVIDYPQDVPQEFLKPVEPEFDKTKLKEYLKNNPNCEFAHLQSGYSITLKA